MGEKLVDSYYIERLHTRIQELEEEVKAKKDGWCICIGENIRLRKVLEEIKRKASDNMLHGHRKVLGRIYAIATEALKER